MVHPSKRIIGENSKELLGKKLLLAVTGSVSIYKSIDLARTLMRMGAEVYVMMSKASQKLVSKDMFEWATGNPVVTELTGNIEHVTLAEDLDAMLISPATANTIVKLAKGISDTPILATALNFIGLRKPVFVVPSMHLPMYNSPQVIEAVSYLRNIGVHVIEPLIVRDLAHFPDIEFISEFVATILARGKDLDGFKIAVTAGPTREYLDPVRFMSNPSSGTMGVAIANEAFFRGADVLLIHGPLSSRVKPYVRNRVEIVTTEEMAEEVKKAVDKGYNVVILAGAPADFKFKKTFESKVDTHKNESIVVELQSTPKVSSVARGRTFLVGFSAETVDTDEELVEKAKIKRERHSFDLIVANNVKRKDIGFSSEYDEVYVIGKDFIRKIDKMTKREIARNLLDIVKEEFKSKYRAMISSGSGSSAR
ncbi:MAG: bifunctional phosphopantothenoylcysteine decarboxylase/phosphopantothenate--cysteine ligase CoaBC [Candidatus Aramenus sulfurataquae]|uniref:Coenzyme A biosynthesis bifunctional protein CoaBC n=2 Tax=Candidatus Aramenus sulfurataquae TaxID=1326980 RepID=A0AAE3FIC1_9CREN|nr:bifunctional phosphopantothenoylcysteine decarboxylase/phosphopantothenate--cysteine ligase CoaBC [Candidatus Aramenus sulfurataquae]